MRLMADPGMSLGDEFRIKLARRPKGTLKGPVQSVRFMIVSTVRSWRRSLNPAADGGCRHAVPGAAFRRELLGPLVEFLEIRKH